MPWPPRVPPTTKRAMIEDQLNRLARWLRWFSICSMFFVPPFILLFPFHSPPAANRCFMVLVLAVMAWLNTVVPVYVTSMLLPIIAIVLKLLRTPDGHAISAPQAADRLVSVMFSSTILVLMASFVIAMAFGRFKLDAVHASRPMQWLSARPHMLLLSVMASVATGSLFMPCLSAALLVQSFLRSGNTLTSTTPAVAKALVMGTVVAGNIGGLISPISSLQSVFAFHLAMEHLQVTWITWMKASIPVAALAIAASWIFILGYYNIGPCTCCLGHTPPDTPVTRIDVEPAVPVPPSSCRLHPTTPHASGAVSPSTSERSDVSGRVTLSGTKSALMLTDGTEAANAESRIGLRLFATIAITALTVVLWSNAGALEPYLGSMGIASLVPMALFFGLRVLPAQDICKLPWDIVLMAMGTLVLNEAARSSGLIASIGNQLKEHIHGLNYWLEIVLVGSSVLVTGTLKSHFVAGLIFLPIVLGYVQNTGIGEEPHGVAMFLTAAYATSVGMALPLSGLINLAASAITGAGGGRVLSLVDFIIVGGTTSLIAFATISTVGLAILLFT